MPLKKSGSYLVEILAVFIAILFVIPFYFVIINSFKSYPEMMTSFITFPKSFYVDNYIQAWKVMQGAKTFLNSIVITFFSVIGIILISSMAAYKLARSNTKRSWVLYLYLIFAMTIPFYTIMIPLVKLAAFLHITKSIFGMVLIYWGMGVPFAVFLLHGFVKTIPMDIEESAVIDGCTPFKTYFYIIMPLMSPVLSTLAVLDVLWIWNDFLLPMLIIFMNKSIRTIPLMQYNLYGEFNSLWNVALAALVIAIIPCLIFFFIMQKYIVRGIISGSVKG